MSTTKQYKSDARAAIHEAASALYDIKAIDKKTMSDFDKACIEPVKPLKPKEIRDLREHEHVSQSVFAIYFNVSKGIISDWERGVKKPSGTASRPLTVVQKHGIESLV